MRTTSTNPMVIMPQLLGGSDAEKGITRRLHVLNADATKVYTVTCKNGQSGPAVALAGSSTAPGRTASTSTRSRWDRR